MKPTHAKQLGAVLQLSQQMLDQAQSGNWLDVTTLEARRKELIASCFSEVAPAKNSAAVGRVITEILHVNQAIFVLGQQASNGLAKELANQASGKAALNAYRDCAGSL